MWPFEHPVHWITGTLLLLSAIGVLTVHKPVHASLAFLVSLIMLALLYLEMSAEFVAVLQVLVYAGAILVIFMFVIVLFQDVYEQLRNLKPQTNRILIACAGAAIVGTSLFFAGHLADLDTLSPPKETLPENFGYVKKLGTTLYVDYFIPFETVVLLFILALVGALYLAKKRVR